MPEGKEVFRAIIAATDDASATLTSIRNKMRELGVEEDHINRHHHGGLRERLKELGEHAHETGEKFDELGEHVSGIGEKITELLPALGAFTAAGGIAAMFEITEKVAEGYGELAHTAASLGLQAQQLHEWNIVAKLTDTNAEAMGKSMGRLNRVLADTVAGKNKDVAGLFSHLHLNPRNFHDSADAMVALADKFEKITDPTKRARMAFALFGRSGTELIPLLSMGSEKLRENLNEARELGYNYTESGKGLDLYNESMKKLSVATGAFTDTIGADLAPVLRPIVDEVTEWSVANRDWIATGITGEVRELGEWARQVPWHEIGEELRGWTDDAGELTQAIGGTKTVVELLAGAMLLKGVWFLAAETAAIVKFGFQATLMAATWLPKLVEGFRSVETAAAAAAVAEESAAGAGIIKAAGLAGFFGLAAAGATVAATGAGIGGGNAGTFRGGKGHVYGADDAARDGAQGTSWLDRKLQEWGIEGASADRLLSSATIPSGRTEIDTLDPVTPLSSISASERHAGYGHGGGDSNITITLANFPAGTTASVQSGPGAPNITVRTGGAFAEHR